MSKHKKHRGKAAKGGMCHYSTRHHASWADTSVNIGACALALAGLKLLCQALQALLPVPPSAAQGVPSALLAFFALASVAAVSIKHCKEVAMK